LEALAEAWIKVVVIGKKEGVRAQSISLLGNTYIQGNVFSLVHPSVRPFIRLTSHFRQVVLKLR
jgi:hypothetical protein